MEKFYIFYALIFNLQRIFNYYVNNIKSEKLLRYRCRDLIGSKIQFCLAFEIFVLAT